MRLSGRELKPATNKQREREREFSTPAPPPVISLSLGVEGLEQRNGENKSGALALLHVSGESSELE